MSQTAAPNVAFIFDCDGTLVNSTPVWSYSQPELLRRHGVDVTPEDFADFGPLSLEDECQAYHDLWGVKEEGPELYKELLEKDAIKRAKERMSLKHKNTSKVTHHSAMSL